MTRMPLFVFLTLAIQSCNNQTKPLVGQVSLQKKVDSLGAFVQKMKPGLGELMLGIQLHHEKLWFAGTNKNWKLADFEIGEIKETVAQAQQIETDRPETKELPMLSPSIESISEAIDKHDIEKFKMGYSNLTQTCNACHQANHFEFNVITTPTAPPVTDQVFTTRNQK